MDDRFYALVNVVEVPDPEDFTIARAKAIINAVERHRDLTIVQLFRSTDTTNAKFECIVVDVECDAVPPQNPYGIQYRERLALSVPEDNKLLIDVLALRKDFPRLLHQHQSMYGSPASLCLYYEPATSVSRTWTAESFLRRIQWWLEKSALDELHPADQPVEQLFFVTKYELVLPWNFGALKETEGAIFAIHCGAKRPDDGQTFFLNAIPANGHRPQNSIQPIELTLPPILHGQVESDPAMLGDLADLLLTRGVDAIAALRHVVQDEVGEAGIAAATDSPFVVILLHVPIARAAGEEYERTAHRAYLLHTGRLKLGLEIGALILHEGKYYKDVLGSAEAGLAAPWRVRALSPMEVLLRNDSQASRRQSGLSDAGPDGVLVGAGALGSAMLDIWGRSGWGRWTVIDKDHVKPHNLVRHTADGRHVGLPKVDAVSRRHLDVTYGASQVNPICADACTIGNDRVMQAMTTCTLVVDASAALDYPRLASTIDEFSRQMSVFITPSGSAAVLLAEDAERRFRLRTLEAQYYRALIHEDWGSTHLDGNLGTFWSGASCRDISMALPYSRVLGHAGNLAEQVQRAGKSDEALIRIWARDDESGAVTVQTVTIFPETVRSFGALRLYIDEGVVRRLRELRQMHAPSETGGVLVGYYDLNVNALVIVDGLPAPADSVSTAISFERGVAGLAESIAEISRRTSGIVRYVGEWHSHPPGQSADPSHDDIVQLAYLALGMADDGLPAVSLIVGESDVQVLQGVLQK